VKVNNTHVKVPLNWAGYDQANRHDFFGAIQVPVLMELIKENNNVSIMYPDDGGHLSSLILRVETSEPDTSETK
jgi:hypothetical protein